MNFRTLTLSAAATAVLTLTLAAPAHAFDVDPVSYGGCHFTATEADMQAVEDSNLAFSTQLNLKVKEKFPERAADVDIVAAHMRANPAAYEVPENVQAAIDRLNAAGPEAGMRDDELGYVVKTANGGANHIAWLHFREMSTQWGYAQAQYQVNSPYKAGPNVDSTAVMEFRSTASQPMMSLITEAASADPAAFAYSDREMAAFDACWKGTALNDEAPAIVFEDPAPANELTNSPEFSFENARVALGKLDVIQALKFFVAGITGLIPGLPNMSSF